MGFSKHDQYGSIRKKFDYSIYGQHSFEQLIQKVLGARYIDPDIYSEYDVLDLLGEMRMNRYLFSKNESPFGRINKFSHFCRIQIWRKLTLRFTFLTKLN